MLDGQHQRVDIPAHTRTSQNGLLQEKNGRGSLRIDPHVPRTTKSVKKLNWTEQASCCKFCTIEFCVFIPVFMSLSLFQGQSGVNTVTLQVVVSWWILIQLSFHPVCLLPTWTRSRTHKLLVFCHVSKGGNWRVFRKKTDSHSHYLSEFSSTLHDILPYFGYKLSCQCRWTGINIKSSRYRKD